MLSGSGAKSRTPDKNSVLHSVDMKNAIYIQFHVPRCLYETIGRSRKSVDDVGNVDFEKCIICQNATQEATTSTAVGERESRNNVCVVTM